MNDFAPLNTRLRYVYLHEIALPFNVELYSYHHGNNLGTLWYIWRIPGDPNKYDPAKTKQMTTLVELTIPEYHTREMRKQFCERFGLVVNAKLAVLTEMYQFLTSDCSRSTIEYHVSEKLKFMLDSQDPEVVFDMRDVNQGRPQIYEQFWIQIEAFINEKALEAVDSRRHSTVCHFAAAFPVRDLRDQVLQKNPGLEAPSLEWIRAQFWPKNPFRKSAANHTGKLQIKFMVQSRQLHADHPDSHYCAAIFKYLKKFAITFREHTNNPCLPG